MTTERIYERKLLKSSKFVYELSYQRIPVEPVLNETRGFISSPFPSFLSFYFYSFRSTLLPFFFPSLFFLSLFCQHPTGSIRLVVKAYIVK